MNELTNINTYLLIIINNPLYHYIPADFQYEYAADADIGYKYLDLYDAVYKDLPKNHHVLKKAKKTVNSAMQSGSQVKGLPSVAGKGRLIYIFQRYRLSCIACLPVRLTGMQIF